MNPIMDVKAVTIDRIDNNAWYRQIAAGWARQMITSGEPGTWAQSTETEVQFSITQLKLRAGDRVLDLGCGWGRHSLALANYGLAVTGLDLSHDLLALARYNARRHRLAVNWVEADLANPPLRGPFDAIAQFCGNFLTWFANREQTLEALWNVSNLLRPGGRLLFGTDDWTPELPERSQHWDEWDGGAAIFRQRFNVQQRLAETQTVIFGPQHRRSEYRRQIWWPSQQEMASLFAQVGLTVCGRYNNCTGEPFDPRYDGLVYVLTRE
ncbi:MAG: class I SAM-dependent methyltransferase [Anaerolineae bacterium]|nr:class I SAM-dependent methyltransferase [Anaerolineae bacterium]